MSFLFKRQSNVDKEESKTDFDEELDEESLSDPELDGYVISDWIDVKCPECGLQYTYDHRVKGNRCGKCGRVMDYSIWQEIEKLKNAERQRRYDEERQRLSNEISKNISEAERLNAEQKLKEIEAESFKLQLELAKNIALSDSLKDANALRNAGRFREARQLYTSIKRGNPSSADAYFGLFLCCYRVAEYRFDSDGNVEYCECPSDSEIAVQDNLFYKAAIDLTEGRQSDWQTLGEYIEQCRLHNLEIKSCVPKYRAIFLYESDNPVENVGNYVKKVYDIVSKKADVFLPEVSLENIDDPDEKENIIKQLLRDTEMLCFVFYATELGLVDTSRYCNDVVRQCKDFMEKHQASELFSICSACPVSEDMSDLSIKTINCSRGFENTPANDLAEMILGKIRNKLLEQKPKDIANDGVISPLNGDYYSPIVEFDD